MGSFTWLPFLGLATALAWACYNVFTYAERHIYSDPTERWVLLLCGAGYLLACMPIVLLPLDVAAMEPRSGCSEQMEGPVSSFEIMWYPIYYATLIVGFVSSNTKPPPAAHVGCWATPCSLAWQRHTAASCRRALYATRFPPAPHSKAPPAPSQLLPFFVVASLRWPTTLRELTSTAAPSRCAGAPCSPGGASGSGMRRRPR